MTDRYYRSIRKDREEWRAEMSQQCMFCDKGGGLEIHEIERRSHAARRWGVRSNYLLLCPDCHGGRFASMKHHCQLAVKLIKDPDHFDLEEWLRIRDPYLKAPQRVTLRDIVRHLRIVEWMREYSVGSRPEVRSSH